MDQVEVDKTTLFEVTSADGAMRSARATYEDSCFEIVSHCSVSGGSWKHNAVDCEACALLERESQPRLLEECKAPTGRWFAVTSGRVCCSLGLLGAHNDYLANQDA